LKKKQNYIWNILQYFFRISGSGNGGGGVRPTQRECMFTSIVVYYFMYVPIVPSSSLCKKNLYILFFREKKNPNKIQEKERTTRWKWNDDICDIFPYDTFYRLETVTWKQKNMQKKKIGLNIVFCSKVRTLPNFWLIFWDELLKKGSIFGYFWWSN